MACKYGCLDDFTYDCNNNSPWILGFFGYKCVCTVEHMWFTLHILILGKMFSNIIFGISNDDYLRIFCATTTFFMKLEGQSNSQFRELSISIYLTINKLFFLMRYWCEFFVSTLQFATSHNLYSQIFHFHRGVYRIETLSASLYAVQCNSLCAGTRYINHRIQTKQCVSGC